jgi:hypothetical protein
MYFVGTFAVYPMCGGKWRRYNICEATAGMTGAYGWSRGGISRWAEPDIPLICDVRLLLFCILYFYSALRNFGQDFFIEASGRG